jgi:hypothetical protein
MLKKSVQFFLAIMEVGPRTAITIVNLVIHLPPPVPVVPFHNVPFYSITFVLVGTARQTSGLTSECWGNAEVDGNPLFPLDVIFLIPRKILPQNSISLEHNIEEEEINVGAFLNVKRQISHSWSLATSGDSTTANRCPRTTIRIGRGFKAMINESSCL